MLANVVKLVFVSLSIISLAGCSGSVDPAARYKWQDHRREGVVLGAGSQLSVDAEGSTDKKMTVAGLTLKTNCEVEFGQDGTLFVDKEGIVGTDGSAREWVSGKIQLDSKDVIAFFPKR